MSTLVFLGPDGTALPHGGAHLVDGLDRCIAGQVVLVGDALSMGAEIRAELREGDEVLAAWNLRVQGVDAPIDGTGGALALCDTVVSPAPRFRAEVFPSEQGASYADAIESRCKLGKAPDAIRARDLAALAIRKMSLAEVLSEIGALTDTHWRVADGSLELIELDSGRTEEISCVGLRRKDGRILAKVEAWPDLGKRVRLKDVGGFEGTVLERVVEASAAGVARLSIWVGEAVHPANERGPTLFEFPGTVSATDPHTVEIDGGRREKIRIRAELKVLRAAGGELLETLPIRAGDETTVRFQTRGLSTDLPTSRIEAGGESSEAYEFQAGRVVQRAEQCEWQVDSLQIRTNGVDIDER